MNKRQHAKQVQNAVFEERTRIYRILRAEWEYWAGAVLMDDMGLILTGPAAEMFDAGTIVGTGAISNMLPAILSGEPASKFMEEVKRRCAHPAQQKRKQSHFLRAQARRKLTKHRRRKGAVSS